MENTFITTNKKNRIWFIVLSIGVLFSFVLSLNFFNPFFIKLMEKGIGRSLRDYHKWSRIIKNLLHIPFLFFACILFLNFFNIGKSILSEIKIQFSNFFNSIKSKKILFIFTIFFLFISYYQIIHSNFYYQDDLFRNYDGDRGWISFGRFISEFLSPFIHTTINLTDIAPLTQFISIFIMAITLYLLCYILTSDKVTFSGIILLSFIFISPFYVQCFCYRFDNPYMTLAVLFSILPFLFIKNSKSFIFMSIICLILTCMSYQSATSIYIMIVIFYSLYKLLKYNDYKSCIKFILQSIISFVGGLLIYKILFMSKPNPIYGVQDYEYYFDTAISLKSIIPNFLHYSKIIMSSFGLWEKLLIIITLLIFSIISFIKSNLNKVLSVFLIISFICLGYFLSLGTYIAFSKTLFAPRVYMGFNAFISLILFYSYLILKESFSSKKSKLLFIPLFCLIYGSVTFLFSFGNCLIQQNEYANFRTKLMINDINELTTVTKPKIELRGNVGYCKTIDLARKKFPVINQLLPSMPGNNGFWDQDIFYFYNFVFDKTTISDDLPLLKTTYYHDIYGKDNCFIIVLKDNNECL